MSGQPSPLRSAEGSVTTPAVWAQSDFRGHVFEPVVAQILVEDGIFKTIRVKMSVKGVGYPDVLAVRSLLVVGVLADIAHQKV